MLKAARAYYDGHHPKALKVREGDKDPNVTVNFCRKIVNASVAWLFGDNESGEMLKMEIEEGEAAETGTDAEDDEPVGRTPGEADADAWLKRVWQLNGGARLMQRLAGGRPSAGTASSSCCRPTTRPTSSTCRRSSPRRRRWCSC
jgi:hypothetical protein